MNGYFMDEPELEYKVEKAYVNKETAQENSVVILCQYCKGPMKASLGWEGLSFDPGACKRFYTMICVNKKCGACGPKRISEKKAIEACLGKNSIGV